MIINVDLDGVVDNFHFAYDVAYTHFVNGKKAQLSKTPVWRAWEHLGISKGEFHSNIRRGVEKGELWHNDPIIEGAREYLWRLSDDGHYIRIVTTRLVHKFSHALIVKATADWLDKNNIPYRSIAFLGEGDSKGAYRADYAIDDNVDNVISMELSNINAVLFDRPWNQEAPLGMLRLKTWQEFYDYVSY